MKETQGLSKIQNYIPIYNLFFDLNESNFQNINLNQQFNITEISKMEKNSSCDCIVEHDNNMEKKKTFLKFSPLIDPIKFMVGKYEKLDKENRIALPQLSNNICHPKSIDPNNSAYIDSFFSYLTSHILHKHKFLHGIDFYGSFLGVKTNFDINIIDDLEYLHDSSFFHENKGKLFTIDPLNEAFLFDADTRNCKRKLQIKKNISNHSVHSFKDLDFENIFNKDKDISGNIEDLGGHLVFEHLNDKSSKKPKTNSSSSTCSSRSSHTIESDAEDTSSDHASITSSISASSDDSEYSNIICKATIHDYPVQIICLEYMSNTLDSLLNAEEEMDDDEWRSCLFQIIIILITYQKMFSFTHNDLHTNNVMFTSTDKEYLYYKYNKKFYKVPTFGRIFKLIDFGRAIYKFNGKSICSDSFHSKGDAATQYNCEPFFNKKKPRLEPNASFDLCRLACSLYDYFLDDEEQSDDDNTHDPIKKIIEEWCTDDKGRNILYKKGGDERYPDFKLYKMIARTVHKHVPQKQVDNPLFHKFLTNRKKIKKKRIIDIDALPTYI